jgi:hypothetical protein
MLQNLLIGQLEHVQGTFADQGHHVEFLRQEMIKAFHLEQDNVLLYRVSAYLNALHALTISYSDRGSASKGLLSTSQHAFSRWPVTADQFQSLLKEVLNQAYMLVRLEDRQLLYNLRRHILDIKAFMLLYHGNSYLAKLTHTLRSQGSQRLVPGYETLVEPVGYIGQGGSSTLVQSIALYALLPLKVQLKQLDVDAPTQVTNTRDPSYMHLREERPSPQRSFEGHKTRPMEIEIIETEILTESIERATQRSIPIQPPRLTDERLKNALNQYADFMERHGALRPSLQDINGTSNSYR